MVQVKKRAGKRRDKESCRQTYRLAVHVERQASIRREIHAAGRQKDAERREMRATAHRENDTIGRQIAKDTSHEYQHHAGRKGGGRRKKKAAHRDKRVIERKTRHDRRAAPHGHTTHHTTRIKEEGRTRTWGLLRLLCFFWFCLVVALHCTSYLSTHTSPLPPHPPPPLLSSPVYRPPPRPPAGW